LQAESGQPAGLTLASALCWSMSPESVERFRDKDMLEIKDLHHIA
jgi:hypothetical protein